MKIKFITTGAIDARIFISPLSFNLRSYYGLRGKYNHKVSWAKTIHNPRLSVDEMFAEIEDEKIDILCISIFIWNKHILFHLAKLVKEKYPNIIVIAGGPDLNAHTNSEFFKENPMIDYVVYGDGEDAFVKLIDAIVGKTAIDEKAVNIVTREKVYPHRVFFDNEYAQKSYWLDLADEVKKDTQKFDINKLSICWEMSRGCPYACAFCDWSAGLHHKVKRRSPKWKEEIDLLASLTSEIRVMDANWGIYREDIEIHKYACQKVFLHARNLPKLNKKAAYDIMRIQHQFYPNSQFAISLQDLNETVLQNVARPEIPWKEHKELIAQFRKDLPNVELIGEFIIGLPGQTVDSWIETLLEVHSVGIKKLEDNIWMLLPNSPAFKQEYQDKFKLVFEELTMITKEFSSYNEITDAVKNGKAGWYKANIITQTYSADLSEILTMFILLAEYNGIASFLKKDQNTFPKVLPIILPNIKNLANELAKEIDRTKVFAAKYNNTIMELSLYLSLPEVRKKFYKKSR